MRRYSTRRALVGEIEAARLAGMIAARKAHADRAHAARSRASKGTVNGLSFFIPMFIYDLHCIYICDLRHRPHRGVSGSADSSEYESYSP